jgi:hypothetical protein
VIDVVYCLNRHLKQKRYLAQLRIAGRWPANSETTKCPRRSLTPWALLGQSAQYNFRLVLPLSPEVPSAAGARGDNQMLLYLRCG